jgi:hypothetical protein
MAGGLDELCAIARSAAGARGHDLDPWQPVPGDQAVARRAFCARCGKPALVRADAGLSGLAGAALMEACSRDGAEKLAT